MAADRHVGFVYLQCAARIVTNQLLMKVRQFGDSSYNRMKVTGNFEIQDGIGCHVGF